MSGTPAGAVTSAVSAYTRCRDSMSQANRLMAPWGCRYSGQKSHACPSPDARACLPHAAALPAWADQRGPAKEQVEFGVQVAQRGLWREAIYRWERATQLDPTYAAAFNNLAVAYEQDGQLDKARAAYEKAMALEPNNQLIKQNFDLFKELNDRAAQKDGRQP